LSKRLLRDRGRNRHNGGPRVFAGPSAFVYP
jgi:hypothetical protein